MPSHSILSDDLLERCAQRAAVYDRENRFFFEDFDELRQAGYLLAACQGSSAGSASRWPKSARSSAGWRVAPRRRRSAPICTSWRPASPPIYGAKATIAALDARGGRPRRGLRLRLCRVGQRPRGRSTLPGRPSGSTAATAFLDTSISAR